MEVSMRDTFEAIDGASEKNDDLRHALYELSAQQLASQALSIAFATMRSIDEVQARQLIEDVAGYPGITQRRMRSDSKTLLGERATEMLISLAKKRPNFFQG
jgi:hypothetical protein